MPRMVPNMHTNKLACKIIKEHMFNNNLMCNMIVCVKCTIMLQIEDHHTIEDDFL